jgi:hypothetical protein
MKKIVNIDSKLQSLCAGDIELKESAKRVFILFIMIGIFIIDLKISYYIIFKALMAYLRSIFLMSNKKLFNIQSIDVVKFSS